MTAELLAVQLGAGRLFHLLASSDEEERDWQIPIIYEGKANSVVLLIDDAETPLPFGTQTVTGTGGTVALGIDYAGSAHVKVGSNPWQKATSTGDDYPVKTMVLSDTQFALNVVDRPVSVPVDFEFSLDDSNAPGAVVQLFVNDSPVATIPSGMSSCTVTGWRIGLWVQLRDPAAHLSLTLQHDSPTTRWDLVDTDVVAAGLVGPSRAALLSSRSERSAQRIGLLRWDPDRRRMLASWVAAHSPLPGGWVAGDRDVYQSAGDLDGDGAAEILVRSTDLTLGGRVGVLRYDPQTGGLTTVWTGRDNLPGGWPVDMRDSWYPVGDLGGTGANWLLVRSLPNALDNRSRVGLASFDRVGGLGLVWTGSGTIKGGWTISSVCSYLGSDADGYLGVGDLNGDRATEVLTWTRSDAEKPALAVLAYDRGARQLVAAWTCQDAIPGGWQLDPGDQFLLAGKGWGKDGGPAVLVQRRAGDLPPEIGLLTFDPATLAASLVWRAAGTLRGGWDLAQDDELVPLGDIDGDGNDEILVRNQTPDGIPTMAVLRPVDGEGVLADGIARGTLGDWKLDPADVLTPLGDVDGDRRTEILIRSCPDEGTAEVALLRFEKTTSSLAVGWRVSGVIPGPYA